MNIGDYLNLIPKSQSDLLLQEWGYDLVHEYFHIAEQLPATKHPVIELATGTGRMCAVLSCLHPNVISGDLSLKDLPRTQQRIPMQFSERVRFLQLDMEHLPFGTERMHTLVCMNTLHEVANPLICLHEMIRVMHPHGILAVGDFQREGYNAMQQIHNIVYHNEHDEGSISSDEIRMTLQASFHSVQSLSTQLNITYFASEKISHQN